MAQIIEAENISSSIQFHSHFNEKCLPVHEINNFRDKKLKLDKCKNYYDEIKDIEKDIIKSELDKKNIENELKNLKSVSDKDIDNIKLKLNNTEEIYLKEKENNINILKDNYNNFELKNKYDIESLDKEIDDLKTEIHLKEESLRNELDYKKQEELFKLKNEFKIKLIQYTNKKKLEKQEKEKEMEIKKKKFEADKAIEFNELKQKALLVQKIISSIKNISLI